MNNLNIALQYLKNGFSVIPAIAKDKKFYIAWAEYQNKLPTEDQVRKWWTKCPDADIAIVTGLISGLVAIDIDSPEGKAKINEYVPDSLIFPIAETPRDGEHWYFRCLDANLKTKAPIPGFTGVDVRANGGIIIAPPSIGSNGKAYQWRENLNILQISIPTIPPDLYAILPKKDVTMQAAEIVTTDMFMDGNRDEDLFHVAWALVRAKLPSNEIYQTLIRLSQACTPPFPIKEAEIKVLSAMKRAAIQPRDIQGEVQQWCLTQDKFRIESCFNELTLLTKEQKSECRNAVTDLMNRRIVERDQGIGVYRQINNTIEHIIIPDHKPESMPLIWPFGIEQMADIYNKNIVVIAGNSNAGKSAFLLNFADMNKDNFKIRYMSSEMDGGELAVRLRGFGINLSVFREKVEWIMRGSDWWDIIEPDGINIIDFMEIYDKFYDVGLWIKKIYDKLRSGIAVIAIQKKNANTDVGRGGEFSIEKSRLYLSMDFNKLTIVKAKNWADSSKNPNGLKVSFTIKYGVIFENVSPWGYK